jgi:3-methyladenine DNA glycosylase/8-oxoguanine DNA glycosylase
VASTSSRSTTALDPTCSRCSERRSSSTRSTRGRRPTACSGRSPSGSPDCAHRSRRLGRVYAFPTRERLAGAAEEELVAVGFSRRKAEYVVGLARSPIDLDALTRVDDDEVRARIVAVRGLGPWTAEWFLARHLGRPRAWPTGDLALRKAVAVLYGVGVEEMGPRLEPFQNLSAHYLLTGARTP